jgi:hypothetical protein
VAVVWAIGTTSREDPSTSQPFAQIVLTSERL